MSPKMRKVVKLIESIGLVAFGITNGIGGVHLWNIQPLFTASMCVLSLICTVRGVAELWEIAIIKRRL